MEAALPPATRGNPPFPKVRPDAGRARTLTRVWQYLLSGHRRPRLKIGGGRDRLSSLSALNEAYQCRGDPPVLAITALDYVSGRSARSTSSMRGGDGHLEVGVIALRKLAISSAIDEGVVLSLLSEKLEARVITELLRAP